MSWVGILQLTRTVSEKHNDRSRKARLSPFRGFPRTMDFDGLGPYFWLSRWWVLPARWVLQHECYSHHGVNCSKVWGPVTDEASALKRSSGVLHDCLAPLSGGLPQPVLPLDNWALLSFSGSRFATSKWKLLSKWQPMSTLPGYVVLWRVRCYKWLGTNLRAHDIQWEHGVLGIEVTA